MGWTVELFDCVEAISARQIAEARRASLLCYWTVNGSRVLGDLVRQLALAVSMDPLVGRACRNGMSSWPTILHEPAHWPPRVSPA